MFTIALYTVALFYKCQNKREIVIKWIFVVVMMFALLANNMRSAIIVSIIATLFYTWKAMPNTVIEAQSTGLPCVIADTITKEADITGLVNYLSLNDSAKVWAEKALSIVEKERKDTKADFIKNGYDIESVVKKFTQLVF